MVDIDFTPLHCRRRRSAEERRLIVGQALEVGASVARLPRKHGVNANQVFAWKRLYESGRLGTPARGMTLVSVRVVEEPAPGEPAVEIPPFRPGMIHIELPGRALISFEDPALVRAVRRSLGA